MNKLCRDIVNHMCTYLLESEIVMLSLTNRHLAKTVNVNTSILDASIRDQNLKWIKLAESWGYQWTFYSYFELGLTGNMDILMYKAFDSYFFVKSYSLRVYHSSQVYNGACQNGHINILELIDMYSNEDHYFQGMKYASHVRNYKSINYLIDKHHNTIMDISRTAVANLDIKLLNYCKKRNIKITGLKYISNDVDVTELDSFIIRCRDLGIKFHKVSCVFPIKIISVLLDHDLYDYQCLTLETCNMLFQSNTTIKHDEFVNKCVMCLMLHPMAKLIDYVRMEKFLNRGNYNINLDTYKQKLLEK